MRKNQNVAYKRGMVVRLKKTAGYSLSVLILSVFSFSIDFSSNPVFLGKQEEHSQNLGLLPKLADILDLPL